MDEIPDASLVSEACARASELSELLARVAADGGGPGMGDEARIATITALEKLKSAACAAQARVAADFGASQRAKQRAAGVPADRCHRGIAAQIALARHISPHQGERLLGVGRALTREMPHTMRALATGRIDEWRATILVRESACLSVSDRAQLDEEVCGDLDSLVGVGARRLGGLARRVAARLDAAALMKRARRAESERCVTIRPAPDQMVYLTALLPMRTGIAAYAAIKRLAQQAIAAGDPAGGDPAGGDPAGGEPAGGDAAGWEHGAPDRRGLGPPGGRGASDRSGPRAPGPRAPGRGAPGRGAPGRGAPGCGGLGAAMADAFVTRLTGRAPAEPVPISVGLIMTDVALLAPPGTPGAEEPAWVEEMAVPIPAAWARTLTAAACRGNPTAGSGDRVGDSGDPITGSGDDAASSLFLRRLFRGPAPGDLAAMDSRSRTAPAGLARFIRYRDLTCASPWCDAPIRHIDHVIPFGEGGRTASTNLQGLCESCNYAKQAPGWTQRVRATADGARITETRTPTGHRYASQPPSLPGGNPATRSRRPVGGGFDLRFADTLTAIEFYLSLTVTPPMRQ